MTTLISPSAASSPGASSLAVRGGTPVSATPVPFMSTSLTEGDIEAVVGVLRSGMLRAASRCAALEEKWAAMTQARHAMTCANGTCALQLAYEPLFQPGDEVLVPAWSYIATAAMIVARGAVPVFVDADPKTYQMNVAHAASKVTPRTKAIAATHLYGCPVDIAGVQALASKHGLRVVYDAAQAHLARYNGQGLGAFGDAVTYSLYATKNLATGEGGLLTCNDDGLARQIKLLRSHGETDKYLHEQVGFNYRMNDLTGALGLSRLSRLEAQTAARQAAAARYDAMVASLTSELGPVIEGPEVTAGATAVWHLYAIRLNLPTLRCTRDEFAKALLAEGVPTAVHYPRALTQQPALKGYAKGDTPVADAMSARVLCLPMHHDLTADHHRIVTEALRKVILGMRA